MKESEDLYNSIQNFSLVKFYLYNFANFFRVGLSFIMIIWTSLQVSNQISAVGQLMLVPCLFNIFFSPLLGTYIDRKDFKISLIFGHSLVLIGTLLPLIFLDKGNVYLLSSLYAMSLFSAVGSIFSKVAYDGIFQSHVSPSLRRLYIAKIGITQQVGLVLGTAVAGLLISSYGFVFSFNFLIFFSLLSFFSAILLPKVSKIKSVSANVPSYWEETIEGIYITLKSKTLLVYCITNSLTFSAANLANMLLPAVVKNNFSGGSELYGFVESSWAIGAIIGVGLIAFTIKLYSLKYLEFLTLFLLGVFSVVVVFVATPVGLITMFFFMGICFSISKNLTEGNILLNCPIAYTGRIRSLHNTLANLIAICIYAFPSLVKIINLNQFFIMFGISLSVLSFFLYKKLRVVGP